MRLSLTAVFLTYNQEPFVREALRSVLSQDCGPFQIVLGDDASSDRTREIIDDELSRGVPHHVTVTRAYATRNSGLIGNFNRCMEHATGEVVISCAGDDISLPHRFSTLSRAFRDPEVQLAFSDHVLMDTDGLEIPPSGETRFPQACCFSYETVPDDIYAGGPICGATAAYRRSLHLEFGPLGPGTHGEDNALWVRSLLRGKISYDPCRLVRWRQHSASMSNFSGSRTDLPRARARKLRFYEIHALMAPQWLRDIGHARAAGFVTASRAADLAKVAEHECLKWLTMHALLGGRPSGMSWLSLLRQLVAAGKSRLALRVFRYALAPWKRERIWARMGLGGTR